MFWERGIIAWALWPLVGRVLAPRLLIPSPSSTVVFILHRVRFLDLFVTVTISDLIPSMPALNGSMFCQGWIQRSLLRTMTCRASVTTLLRYTGPDLQIGIDFRVMVVFGCLE